LNANYHGGERAFVVSGQYEKVLPMDILPVFLLKAILVNDIDKMENLGIFEVIEEDMALCEYVCTSKIEVQSILRNGINTMIKELA
jgi:Na+-transporting NADH:ubiquinone oxidoreductase subunit A